MIFINALILAFPYTFPPQNYIAVNTMKPETQSLYHRLGGEATLRAFVQYFYDYMDNLPEVKPVRDIHAADLDHAREALYLFLSGMFGGPPLYMEAYGHPRLRRNHLRFSIGNEERDQWLLCAQKASDNLKLDPLLSNEMMTELTCMANHLRNQPDSLQQQVGIA